MEAMKVQTIDIEIVRGRAHAVDVLANMWSFTDSEATPFLLLSDEQFAEFFSVTNNPQSFTSFVLREKLYSYFKEEAEKKTNPASKRLRDKIFLGDDNRCVSPKTAHGRV
ncbi:hypothetical protein Aduo_011817 [Ancylostoma duodenale]